MNNEMKERVEEIQATIDEAMKKAHRSDELTLMAVSKNHPYSSVLEALECSLTVFGENRVQEIAQKFENQLRPENFSLHLIGHLQSNKVKKVVPLVDGIDSVDSEKLVRMINQESEKHNKVMPILLEIDTAQDGTKHGFSTFDEVYRVIEVISTLENIHLKGLMTVGPLTSDEGRIKRAFGNLKELQMSCQQKYKEIDLSVLSMGMSGDYVTAIESGSTLVRIGTAIFGSRGY
jgi:pyridoxal phosphate enzyme (YggS family)